MLSRDKAERMLDAPNFEDAAKMLTDSGYEDMSQMSVKQIETALSDRRAAVFHELETLIPNTAALDLFRLKYDYHNAKVLVKSEAMHRNDASLLSSSGRVAPETVQKRRKRCRSGSRKIGFGICRVSWEAQPKRREICSPAAPTRSSPTSCLTRHISVR